MSKGSAWYTFLVEKFTKTQQKLFKKLNTPAKIQDFINTIPINFELNGDTCLSPFVVMKNRKAHCIEGAMLSAYILSLHGHKPLIMDLKVSVKNHKDFDHTVALFKIDGYFGAISKTNHAVLRYREPIYKTLRELALSYFHEYFTNDGKKNLRTYSLPLNLNKFNKKNWVYDDENVWYIPTALDESKHYSLLNQKQTKNLRKADGVEIESGKITEYKKNGKK